MPIYYSSKSLVSRGGVISLLFVLNGSGAHRDVWHLCYRYAGYYAIVTVGRLLYNRSMLFGARLFTLRYYVAEK